VVADLENIVKQLHSLVSNFNLPSNVPA
jgi:hypothetical protein